MNLVTAGMNLYKLGAGTSLVTVGMHLVTAGMDLYTAGMSLVTAGMDIYTAGMTLVTLSQSLHNSAAGGYSVNIVDWKHSSSFSLEVWRWYGDGTISRRPSS